MRFAVPFLIALATLLLTTVPTPELSADSFAFPGTRSAWNGFSRFDFEVEGKPVLVVAPSEPAPGKPWLWRGEFFGHRPEPDLVLLGRGYHVVYMQIPNLFGSPEAVKYWDAFYKVLTEKHGLNPRAALIGVSRGGLYCYNWAARNPEKVAGIYGDAPVCDVRSWPAGKGKGTGNPGELVRIREVYEAATDEELFTKALNPIDHLEPLAKAGIPLLHVYGDADTGVPWDENTGVLAERYRKLGGQITLIAKPGIGHVHGLDDCTPIVDFIEQAYSRRSNMPKVLDLGTRRELFVDDYLVERLTGLRRRLHEPRDEGVVLKLDKPWEGPYSGYVTVLKDGDRFRLYYRGRPVDGRDGDGNEYTCVAESRDGVEWKRPKLRLHKVRGQRENNVILAEKPFPHNFAPLLDTRPGCPPNERYKALAGVLGDGLFAFASSDGIHWRKLQDKPAMGPKPIDTPGFVHAFDSMNVGFWSESEQKYLCYFRSYENGMRRIYRTESADFRAWSKPQRMEYVTYGAPAPLQHLYTNQTSPYFRAPQLYLAIAARFMPGRQVVSADEAKKLGVDPTYIGDTSDTVLMSTRGGNFYDRTFLDSFIRPGLGLRNWVSRTNYPALNVVQTGPEELSLYVNQDYAQSTAHIRRYSLRLDGFASLRAENQPGELLTRPLTFSGKRLLLNFATSAAGSLRVEVQDADGKPMSGFALADCSDLIGNEIERSVRWKHGEDTSQLTGKTVRLRIVMEDADLYALRFAE